MSPEDYLRNRVAGPIVTASASPLAAAAMDQSYKDLLITGYLSANTGSFFTQLLLGAGGSPSTTLSDYYLLGTTAISSGTFGILNQQAPWIGYAYQTTGEPNRFRIVIPDYSVSSETKVAFFEYWGGPGGSGHSHYHSGSIRFVPTGSITQVQISVRDSASAIGTAQDTTGRYQLTYLV